MQNSFDITVLFSKFFYIDSVKLISNSNYVFLILKY